MFQFMLVVGLVLAYYGYAVTKNPRIWGDQGRDAIKEENWNIAFPHFELYITGPFFCRMG